MTTERRDGTPDQDMAEGASTRVMERDDLFTQTRSDEYASRWEDIQVRFVDDPQATVTEADALVRDVIDDLTQTFEAERTSLESQWGEGQETDTEGLRVALQRYRSFFQRLLSRETSNGRK